MSTVIETVDDARRIILDCDDPQTAAAEFYNQPVDVDKEGDVWLEDVGCWADDDHLIRFAESLAGE